MSTATISFPGLGLTMDPPQGFDLGPLYINLYGILIAVGLMAAVVYACRRCAQFGLKEDDILDGVLWVTPLAIVCARFMALHNALGLCICGVRAFLVSLCLGFFRYLFEKR